MYSIMIVEKRNSMVQIYRNMIPWEQYGFVITSITSEEQQALSFYGEYRHEAILMDLDLNKGDGLSLIHKLKQLDPKCNIAVISERDDFYSVQQAFRRGAFQYIRKQDLKYSVIVALALELKEKIINNSELSWEGEMEKMLGLIRDHQQYPQDKWEECLQDKRLEILNQPYYMMLFRMDHVRQINRKLKDYNQPEWQSSDEFIHLYADKLEQREEMRMVLENIVRNLLKEKNYQLLFIKKHSGIILFEAKDQDILMNYASRLKTLFKQALGYDFSIVISKESNRTAFLKTYLEVLEGIKNKFYIGDNSITNLQEIQTFLWIDTNALSFKNQILEDIKKKKEAALLKHKDHMLHFMYQNKVHPDEVITYCLSILEEIEKSMKKNEVLENKVIDLQKEAIKESETYAFLSFEMDRIFKTIRDQLHQKETKQNQKLNMMLQFMEQNLYRKLTAEEIASYAGWNFAYASRIMKKVYGCSMIQMLNQKRIEKAMQYMEHTTWKIKEIAKSVGIEDQLYFNRLFHKYTGCSPTDYRKKYHIEEC